MVSANQEHVVGVSELEGEEVQDHLARELSAVWARPSTIDGSMDRSCHRPTDRKTGVSGQTNKTQRKQTDRQTKGRAGRDTGHDVVAAEPTGQHFCMLDTRHGNMA